MQSLICFSSTRWYYMYQRPQQLMSLFSRDFKVAYINPPKYTNINASGEHNLDEFCKTINPNLMVFTPPRPYGLNQSPRVKTYFTALMKKFIKKYGFEDPILWFNMPEAGYLCGELGEKLVIYDCLDDYASFSWTPLFTSEADADLTQRADIVFVVSDYLYELKHESSKYCYLIQNACDFSHFSKAVDKKLKTPEDIESIKHPRIGFVGALYEWVDYNLIRYLARRNSDWSIVLVGPKHYNVRKIKLPNVYYIGRKRYRRLPAYQQELDVCLIPFNLSNTSLGSSPVKMYEYLASGKPVVSTRLPEVEKFGSVVEIADSKEEFELKIKKLLAETETETTNRVKLQLEAAKNHNWEDRYSLIKDILLNHGYI